MRCGAPLSTLQYGTVTLQVTVRLLNRMQDELDYTNY
jgi:hypothetical protein